MYAFLCMCICAQISVQCHVSLCCWQCMYVNITLVCIISGCPRCPQVVAMTSTIIGYLTLTEDGQVTEPLVPVVRLVVGSLQFLVAAFAVLAVLLAALGVKPGGKQFLLVVSLCMLLGGWIHSICVSNCLVLGLVLQWNVLCGVAMDMYVVVLRQELHLHVHMLIHNHL